MRIAACIALVLVTASPALADKHDLVLSRLAETSTTGDDVIADAQAFRSLASELGVVLAPRFLSGAETLGLSGFQFSTQLSYTTISSDKDFWCATEENAGCGGGQTKGSQALSTVGFFARKGIWLPIPSFEVGAGALHLVDSRMWAGQVYGKFALHEGFHDWPVPSLSARGAASRLFGSEQLDLTVASLDVDVSKPFGVAGVVTLEPYIGFNWLWVVARSEVIDHTPHIDPLATPDDPSDLRMNFVFPAQDTISRSRLFGGFTFEYEVFLLAFEANIAFAGDSMDDRAGSVSCASASADELASCDAEDQSGTQATFSFALALDF